METYSTSHFKHPETDKAYISQWINKLQELNTREYERIDVITSLGNTVVWGYNTQNTACPLLFVFPGFRTSSLFWDIDNNLQQLQNRYRIYLVETNGQPVLSDGNTPDIKGLGYGYWAAEVIRYFTTSKVNVAGASFGGLVCLKLAIANPDIIDNIFLLNPGCLQPFSLSLKNLFYNLLPIIKPSARNVERFLNKAVLYPPVHSLPPNRMEMLIDYEVFALTRHVDKAQKPYAMTQQELKDITAPIHLIWGEKDLLFPYQISLNAARVGLKSLKSINTLANTGHGIETSKEALSIIDKILSGH